MAPSTITELLVIVLLLSPGYTYVRVVERRIERYSRSALLEFVDLLWVGASVATVAALFVGLMGSIWPHALVDLAPSLVGAKPTLSPGSVLRSSMLFVAISHILAVTAAVIVARRGVRPHFAAGSVWSTVLSTFESRPADEKGLGTALLVSAQLADGRLVGGQFFGGTKDGTADRDIALVAPLWKSEPDGTRTDLPHDFIIVNERNILVLWGMKVDISSPVIDERDSTIR